MIQKFVDRYMESKDILKDVFSKEHPGSYTCIVKAVVEILGDGVNDYSDPDPERIHKIDDGDYQGTLLFVIAAKGYQPREYWYVFVDYGSCSGCDTLENIRSYQNDPPTEEQVKDYMTLALHIVQGLKEM